MSSSSPPSKPISCSRRPDDPADAVGTWRYNLAPAARRLLEADGWSAPNLGALPTGADLVHAYLAPLAKLPALARGLATGIPDGLLSLPIIDTAPADGTGGCCASRSHHCYGRRPSPGRRPCLPHPTAAARRVSRHPNRRLRGALLRPRRLPSPLAAAAIAATQAGYTTVMALVAVGCTAAAAGLFTQHPKHPPTVRDT